MRIIAGEYKGRTLRTGSGPGYRPATGKVRESLFSMLEARGVDWSGINVLDLFAGSGALGFEALSRGAKSALFIEKSSRACAIIRQNIFMLGIGGQRARVINTDAITFLNKQVRGSFDLVFVDPPYGMDLARPALDGLLKTGLLSEDALISAEIEKNLPLESRFLAGLNLIKDKHFGQTRILIWKKKQE